MKKIVSSCLLFLLAIHAYAVLPDVTLYDMDGRSVNVETLAKTGKPVIISFFATWCKPCLRELKAFAEFYPDWQEETGVQMVIVSEDQGQDVQKVKPLVNGNGWEYYVLLDSNGTLKRAMNVHNIPHLFVLDSTGKIVYTHTGFTDGDETDVFPYLK